MSTDRDKRDTLVFSGSAAQTPADIAKAVGWLDTENPPPHPLDKLCGAIRSLCKTVERMQLEQDALKFEVAQLKGAPSS